MSLEDDHVMKRSCSNRDSDWSRGWTATIRNSEEERKDSPLQVSEVECCCWHLDFWTSDLWNCETIHFCVLSHPVCDTSLWQPRDTNEELNESTFHLHLKSSGTGAPTPPHQHRHFSTGLYGRGSEFMQGVRECVAVAQRSGLNHTQPHG